MHPEITRALIRERVRDRQEAAAARWRIRRLPRGRRLALRAPWPRVAWSS
jgi:hypothetical protein